MSKREDLQAQIKEIKEELLAVQGLRKLELVLLELVDKGLPKPYLYHVGQHPDLPPHTIEVEWTIARFEVSLFVSLIDGGAHLNVLDTTQDSMDDEVVHLNLFAPVGQHAVTKALQSCIKQSLNTPAFRLSFVYTDDGFPHDFGLADVEGKELDIPIDASALIGWIQAHVAPKAEQDQ